MRPRLIAASSLLAVLVLMFALKGEWGEALAPEGMLLRVSLHGITQVPQLHEQGAALKGCNYLRGKGAVELCGPAAGGDAAYSMLCAAFPLILAGLVLALGAGALTVVSPYARRGTAAALAGAAFVSSLAGTLLAMIAMRPALAALDGLGLSLGGPAYTAAWLAIGMLAFAAGLATTTTMLGHT